MEEYLGHVTRAGFGMVEIRSRRPFRVLDHARYQLDSDLLLESIEVLAIKAPTPEDGPCIFAGEAVIYVGPETSFDDRRGHIVQRDIPLSVCRKTAAAFRAMNRDDIIVTAPTWHYAGGGCC
jgi:hypothetical protein